MQNRCKPAIFAVLASLIIAALACNVPAPSPTSNVAGIVSKTQTAIALQIFLTSTAAAQKQPPAAQLTQAPGAQPTNGPAPTAQASQASNATPPAQQVTIVPPSGTNAAACTDKAKFEAETVPDDTAFAPGGTFMKTWTLRNVGTCTWTPDYSLVFVNGEQMGGTSPSPLGGTVPPNGTIQVYLPQTAPQDPGEHQGFWKLRNLQGQEFGLGAKADVAFWSKIQVQPGIASQATPDASRGAPTNRVTFQGKNSPFYLGSDSDIAFDVKNGALVMTALKPDGDQWRIAHGTLVSDFYMEVQFQTGDECSGKDSYGLLVRAPDQPDGVIDAGYVFAFSCDGQFRLYRMDYGSYYGLVNWTASPAVKPGPRQANVMALRAKSDLLQLYANGVLLYELLDPTYSIGLYGLLVRSEVTNDFQTLVKEIDYWNKP